MADWLSVADLEQDGFGFQASTVARQPKSKDRGPRVAFLPLSAQRTRLRGLGSGSLMRGAKVLAKLSSTHPRRCPTRRARTYAVDEAHNRASTRHRGAGNCRKKRRLRLSVRRDDMKSWNSRHDEMEVCRKALWPSGCYMTPLSNMWGESRFGKDLCGG